MGGRVVKIPLAERFKAPQGEGLFAGAEMAFARVVGCSVGQGVCTHCDTDFSRMIPELGGGLCTPAEIVAWASPCRHLCLTGGEPLDRDIRPLLDGLGAVSMLVHVETSGTVHPAWLDQGGKGRNQTHAVGFDSAARPGELSWRWVPLWVTVSPKPGYLDSIVRIVADEVKVILGGLGDGPGWPTLGDAVRWADEGKLVYVQPRNARLDIDRRALDEALQAVARHPQLRLSVQLHKFVRTR